MFEDLRFDRDTILDMDTDMIRKLAPLYRCTTVNTLCRYLGA